jgi:hypothetical protein
MWDVLLRREGCQWVIELRKMGGRMTLNRTHPGCSRGQAEARAREWADFMGATLTVPPAAEVPDQTQ